MHPNDSSASRPGAKLESWASGVLAGLVFLAPLFFVPSAYLQQSAAKAYLIVFAVLAAGILHLVSRWKAGSSEWIRHPLWCVGAVFAAFLVVSAAASGNFMASFFGQGFEFGTAAFLIVLLIAARLSALLTAGNPSRAFSLYTALFAAFALLAVFAFIKLAFPAALSFGIFTGSVSTPIGSWYDLAIISGVIFILSSMAFGYFPFNRLTWVLARLLWLVSAFFLLLADLPVIWFGLALVFLALAVHSYLAKGRGTPLGKRLPIPALVIFLVCAVLSWQATLVLPLADALHAGYSEVHLPWQMTLAVGASTIEASPIIGSGPNTFGKEYLLYKPLTINSTGFSSADFSSGSGFVPTLAVTLGAVGLILLCLFYVYFFRIGASSLGGRRSENQPFLPYLSHSSFFGAAFLSYMAIVYAPSGANLLLLAVLGGISLGSLAASGAASVASVPLARGSRLGLWARSALVAALVVMLAGLAWYALKVVALGSFARGAALISGSSPSPVGIVAAESDFKRSAALDPLDIYDQALAQADLSAVSAIVGQLSSAGQNAQPTADQTTEIGNLLKEAAGYAALAVRRDPTDYANYLTEVRVYSAAASLGATGAYDSAIAAYQTALKYDPYDPGIYLDMAQLAASEQKYDDATQYVGSALQLKNNDTDAVWLLAQVQVAQGKTADAVTSAQFAVELTPDDPTAYFQLGILQYNENEYSAAATSLAKAVSLSPNYANAQYFLGLSYSKIGDTDDAIAQFQALAESNPDNADVASILANLEAGKAPFANQAPPVSTPEKRPSVPVSDAAPGGSDAGQ